MAKAPSRLSAAPRTDAARQRLWAAQDALGAIKRAEQVRSDPTLMRDVRALAKQEAKVLTKVTGGGGKK